MTISLVSAKCDFRSATASSLTLYGYTSGVAIGDLMVCAFRSAKPSTAISTGWTDALVDNNDTSSGGWGGLRVAHRFADGSSDDNCVITCGSSNVIVGCMAVWHTTAMFDADPVQGSVLYAKVYSSTTQLDLPSAPGNVGASGVLPIAIGLDVGSVNNLTVAIVGTEWSTGKAYSGTYLGHAAIGTASDPTTVKTPGVTYSSGVSTYKAIAYLTLQESAASGLAGGGLFWGGGA